MNTFGCRQVSPCPERSVTFTFALMAAPVELALVADGRVVGGGEAAALEVVVDLGGLAVQFAPAGVGPVSIMAGSEPMTAAMVILAARLFFMDSV